MTISKWEEAVCWLRGRPEHRDLVLSNYYDDPLVGAAERFADSPEWRATRQFLPARPGSALDLGAGRGIASYALARDGWRVTAIEPDPGCVVGAGAIRALAGEAGLQIRVVEERGESIPFADGSFDLVYGRALLHHVADLDRTCAEVQRVLKAGGRFVAAREHVVWKEGDLRVFLERHPLHELYGGENARRLGEYTDAVQGSGLTLLSVLGPYDGAVNFDGIISYNQWWSKCTECLIPFLGVKGARVLTSKRHPLGTPILRLLARRQSRRDRSPGCLYSFISERRS